MTAARPDSFGAPRALGGSRRAPIHSGRAERWGVEARPDSFGARRALGGLGGHFGAPQYQDACTTSQTLKVMKASTETVETRT